MEQEWKYRVKDGPITIKLELMSHCGSCDKPAWLRIGRVIKDSWGKDVGNEYLGTVPLRTLKALARRILKE